MQDGDPFDNFQMINNELRNYDDSLLEKPQLVVLTKTDISEVREQLPALRGHFESLGYPVFVISAVTGEGLKELVDAVGAELDRRREKPAKVLDMGIPPHLDSSLD